MFFSPCGDDFYQRCTWKKVSPKCSLCLELNISLCQISFDKDFNIWHPAIENTWSLLLHSKLHCFSRAELSCKTIENEGIVEAAWLRDLQI